jgi:hypothetical protein
MNEEEKKLYNIPIAYRKMENLHIVFWIFKDIAWCMFWEPLGIAMIIPTLTISFIIAWRTRHIVSELCHNLAISVWIMANSFWMCSEFFHVDEKVVVGNITVKQLAMIPFVIGSIILAYYYLIYKPRHKEVVATL